MTPKTHIRRLTALLAASAVALVAATSAGASTQTSYDPWAVGLVHQYQASGNGFDPWAVGLVHRYQASGSGLDPWAVGLVREASGLQFAGSTAVQPPVAAATADSSGFDFGAAAIGAGAALLAVFVIGGSAMAFRRHHQTPQLSS